MRRVFAASSKRADEAISSAPTRRALHDCATATAACRRARRGSRLPLASSSGRWKSALALTTRSLSRASSSSVTPLSVALATFCGAQLKEASHSNTIRSRTRLRYATKSAAERVAIGECAGRPSAQLRAVVAAQVRLQCLRPVSPLPDSDGRAGVARAHGKVRVAVDALLAPLDGNRQHYLRQREVVLPCVLPLPRL